MDWLAQQYALIDHGLYPLGVRTSYGTSPAEPIPPTLAGFSSGALKGDGVVFACERLRLSVFSEARFQFQQMRGGRPGDLFGTPELALLERPFPGGTTGDLLSRMLLDADLAGNAFIANIDGEAVRLRPDWVEIVITPRQVPGVGDGDGATLTVGYSKVGYFYYEGGPTPGQQPAFFLADEVAHFAPMPDPEASFRGMSWLTPVVREIQADVAATRHKLKFFENAATPNLAVSMDKSVTPEKFAAFMAAMDDAHKGVENAYKTLYTAGGADVTVIGADMHQLDFKVTQGAGETRIAAAAGVHPVLVGLSEGLAGSSLNAGNFASARRSTVDGTMRPLWRNAAGSLETLLRVPQGARLWFDDRDIAYLREDQKDAAAIQNTRAISVRQLTDAGYDPASVVAAVIADDLSLLKHSGLYSVQLQPPGSGQTPTAGE